MKRYYVLLFAAIIFAGSFVAAYRADAEITVTEEIIFGKAGDYLLYGDMYVPEGEGPFPGILFIHGGGFFGGDKLRPLQAPFYHIVAEEGYTVFSINYRLIQEGGVFPNCIKDAKTGLAWMIANKDKYKIDADRMGVIGMSAGAHLAAMVAFTPNNEKLQPEAEYLKNVDTSVDAAVLFYPPTNFNTFNGAVATILKDLIRKETRIKGSKKMKKYLRMYSPINHVKKETPIFLSFSVPDGIVDNKQQYELIEKMEETGTEFEQFTVSGEGLGHGFICQKPDDPQSVETRKRMLAFLDKHVKNAE